MTKIEKMNWEFREYDAPVIQTVMIVLKSYQDKINEIIDYLNKEPKHWGAGRGKGSTG